MKKTLLSAVIVIASLASCKKESADKLQTPGIAGKPTTLSLSATVPSYDDSKTFFHYSGNIYWNQTDALSVFDESNSLAGIFDIKEGNTATGEFTCESWAGGVPSMALFCLDSKGEPCQSTYSDGKYTAHLLATQKGNNPNSFSAFANTAIGQVTGNEADGYAVQMKNILGLVRVDFTSLIDKDAKKSTMKSVTLEDANGEADLAGEILVSYNNGEPTFELVEGTGEKVLTRVNSTATLPLAVSSTGCVYFNVLPGVSFVPKFTFTDMNDDKQAVVIANGPIKAERSMYFPCGEPKITWGKQKETAVFDFKTWCMKETLVKTANKTTTYTLATGTEFLKDKAKIIVTTSSATCNYTTAGDLRFYKQAAASDPYPTIEIPVRDGYKIAKVSISTNSSTAKYFTLKDKDGEQLGRARLSTGTTAIMTVDVENTTGANGCVFHLADATSQYQVSRISVTYVKDLQ